MLGVHGGCRFPIRRVTRGSLKGRFKRLEQRRQSAGDIFTYMDPQHSSAVFAQRFKIAERLSAFEDAERVRLVRNRRVDRLLRSDMQEEAGVRTAFVELPGGMKVARPVTDRRGDMQPIPQQSTDRLKPLLDVRLFGEVRQQRHIIPDVCVLKESSQHIRRRMPDLLGVERQRPFHDRRSFFGQSSSLLDARKQTVGVIFALLHIRLIEWVNAEDRPGGRRGHFPTEEFLSKIERIFQLNAHDRFPRRP